VKVVRAGHLNKRQGPGRSARHAADAEKVIQELFDRECLVASRSALSLDLLLRVWKLVGSVAADRQA